MVESLKELNKICQKPRYREIGNLYVRYVLRDAALPITWLLLHTKITANQVTLLSLIIALFGIALTVMPSNSAFLIGTLLLQLWYLLDHVDGQIARYRNTSSLTGRFFDFLMHHLIHGVLFFGLACYVFQITGGWIFIVWGFLTSAAMFMFNLIYDTMYKTFFEHILFSGSTISVKSSDRLETKVPGKNMNFLKTAFSTTHKLCEIHIVMSVLTLGAFLNFFNLIPLDFRVISFYFYGIAVPVLATGKIAYFIKNKRVDAEYESCFGAKSHQKSSKVIFPVDF